MVKYVNAELYKVIHRKYPYIFTFVLLALAGLFMAVLYVEGRGQMDDVIITQRVSVDSMINVLTMSLALGLYLLLVAADAVFSEQYKHNTLKNEVSFGLPRIRIYFGKLLTAILTSFLLCGVLIAGYLALSFALFPTHGGTGETLINLAQAILMAIPLWLGGLGFFFMLQFLMKGSSAAIIYVVVIAVSGSDILSLIGMFVPSMQFLVDFVQTVSLFTPFNLMARQGPENVMGYAWGLGMAWFALSTVIGLIGFQKKEIS